MTPVTRFEGVVAPLLRPNIDTDAIIPSREMKRVSRRGMGEGLFAGWRYRDPDTRDPDEAFVLNRPAYAGASILASGPNFGCGSSREHAVWALLEFGIRAIVAPSFGAIFERNCYNNGLLPITLSEDQIGEMVASTAEDPQSHRVGVDLEAQSLSLPGGTSLRFTVPEVQLEMLLNGWDPIDRSLRFGEAIDAFLARDRLLRPWVYDLAALNPGKPQ